MVPNIGARLQESHQTVLGRSRGARQPLTCPACLPAGRGAARTCSRSVKGSFSRSSMRPVSWQTLYVCVRSCSTFTLVECCRRNVQASTMYLKQRQKSCRSVRNERATYRISRTLCACDEVLPAFPEHSSQHRDVCYLNEHTWREAALDRYRSVGQESRGHTGVSPDERGLGSRQQSAWCGREDWALMEARPAGEQWKGK